MKRGRKARRLTDLELEIMQVVWQADPEPLTVREVVERMRGSRRSAYTTIQTVMGILARKGALRSRPGPGRAHEYRARWSRSETTSSMTRDFVDRLFGGSARPLLSALIEHQELSRDELEELRRRIESQLEDERSAEEDA
jgi:predicted transcriptional regulator